MDILSMQNVSLSFGSKEALKCLSFAVKEGEIFGFLGPSGAGKTTTIKLLTRQLKADTGEAEVFGIPVNALKNEAYEEIGILSDNSGVYERLSVYENMKLFADLRGIDAAHIDEVLGRVGLLEDKKTAAKKLSRGMRQRLILAMAVLHAPRLLFLDEPTSALDPANAGAIHKLLREMNAAGTTIFLTTHNMEEADRLCTRVAFLNEGHIAELGAPAQLKLAYAQDTVRVCTVDGETLECEKNAVALASLSQRLGGKVIATVHSVEPDLEQIFLRVTGRELV